jgi:choice-of-anchor A domain-containing protein
MSCNHLLGSHAMRCIRRSLFALVLFCGATSWLASPAQATLLSEWNLIVKNDVTTSSEVDGSTLIGGNLTGTSNYSIHSVTASNGDGLAVGGNLVSGNIQINNGGNLRLGGTNTATVNLNGGGATIIDPTVSAQVAADFTYLDSLSANLAALTPNGTLDGAGNFNAVPVNMGGQLVAVYNVTAASLTGLGQLNLNLGSANSVIINVSGDPVSFVAPPNIIGGFNQANSSKILWNLTEATNVSVNNSFNGALLAPLADLKVLGGGMNGTVAVASISQQSAEIRDFTYTGYLPPVPEPSSIVLAGLAGVGMIAWRWRRRSS